MTDAGDLKSRAELWPKGNRFEAMTPDRVFEHHWGRTITDGDNAAFTTSDAVLLPAVLQSSPTPSRWAIPRRW